MQLKIFTFLNQKMYLVDTLAAGFNPSLPRYYQNFIF